MDWKKRPSKPVEALGKGTEDLIMNQDMKLSEGDEQDIMRRAHEPETKHVELAHKNMELEHKVRERTAELTMTIAAVGG